VGCAIMKLRCDDGTVPDLSELPQTGERSKNAEGKKAEKPSAPQIKPSAKSKAESAPKRKPEPITDSAESAEEREARTFSFGNLEKGTGKFELISICVVKVNV